MYLKQLIEYLEKKDCDLVVPIGFDEPHSYRGDYMCLAFKPAGDVTVGAMLQCARDAIGSIYEGSNGAHYRMNLSTEVYLAIRGKSSEKIGTVLLDYMTGVYDSEECEHLRGVINRSTDEIAGLIVDRNNVRTDLAAADAELFEYRKKIVEQSKAIHDLTTDTADEIKVDRCRIDSLVEERNDLNRWFINDRDTLRSIERTCAELGMYNPDMKIRDVKAIKSMRRISNIMNEWDPNIGRAKEAESHSNGKDMLSAAVGAIRGIEAANLKTTNDLLRAHIENMNEEREKINRVIEVMTGTISDQNEVIKKQNQTILTINAELEVAKQFNPFDLVLMAGSMENISNVINGQTEPFIDEGCVESCKVCARSCKVVDIAAGLQEEIGDLKTEVNRLRGIIRNEHAHNTDLLESNKLKYHEIELLEAELSARKQDSVALKKVVGIVKNWDDSTGRAFPTLYKILDLLVDYTDAPEGPPETPWEGDQK